MLHLYKMINLSVSLFKIQTYVGKQWKFVVVTILFLLIFIILIAGALTVVCHFICKSIWRQCACDSTEKWTEKEVFTRIDNLGLLEKFTNWPVSDIPPSQLCNFGNKFNKKVQPRNCLTPKMNVMDLSGAENSNIWLKIMKMRLLNMQQTQYCGSKILFPQGSSSKQDF